MNSGAFELFFPEYLPGDRYHFAKEAKYIQASPVLVQDYSLWAVVDSLDCITSPFTVLLTKMSGSATEMYPVVCDPPLKFTPPVIFEQAIAMNRIIYFVPRDRFLMFEASNSCVQVLGNKWSKNGMRYHVLGALFRIGVIPSLSQAVFSHEEIYEDLCSKFYSMYEQQAPIQSALRNVFNELYITLKIFGFTVPTSYKEKQSINAVENLIQSNDQRGFAFSEIKWCITNYQKSCFPSMKNHEVLTNKNYVLLMNALDYVKSSLSHLGLIPSGLSPYDGIIEGVHSFQKKSKIPVGVCDLFTLRRLWNTVSPSLCDFVFLCTFCGMESSSVNYPIFRQTLPKIKTLYADPNTEFLERSFNDVITHVKTYIEAPQWLISESIESVKRNNNRIGKIDVGSVDMEKAIGNIKSKVESYGIKNEQISTKFEQVERTLDSINEEHVQIREDFSAIQNLIGNYKKGNQLLIVIIIILSIRLIWKWFKL